MDEAILLLMSTTCATHNNSLCRLYTSCGCQQVRKLTPFSIQRLFVTACRRWEVSAQLCHRQLFVT